MKRQLLSLNLPACGFIIEEIVCMLAGIFKWESLLGKGTVPRQQRFAILFAQYLLGMLDLAEEPLKYPVVGVPIVDATAAFMSEFFGGRKSVLV